MLKIKVIWKDENNDINFDELNHLRPRMYMCGWSFGKLLKYIKDELYWCGIDEKKVDSIQLYSNDGICYGSVCKVNA